jgi:hypothetical protein
MMRQMQKSAGFQCSHLGKSGDAHEKLCAWCYQLNWSRTLSPGQTPDPWPWLCDEWAVAAGIKLFPCPGGVVVVGMVDSVSSRP